MTKHFLSRPGELNGVNASRRDFLLSAPLVLGAFSSARASLIEASSLRFFVIGDWGRSGHAYQRNVAWAMGVHAATFQPKFVISTGDNFYDFGVWSPDGWPWSASFEDIRERAARLRVRHRRNGTSSSEMLGINPKSTVANMMRRGPLLRSKSGRTARACNSSTAEPGYATT